MNGLKLLNISHNFVPPEINDVEYTNNTKCVLIISMVKY